MKKSQFLNQLSFAFYTFIIFGLLENIRVAAVPLIIKDTTMSYSEMGMIITGIYIGASTVPLVAGVISRHIHLKKLMWMIPVTESTGILIFTMGGNHWIMLIGAVFIGCGFGLMQYCCNMMLVNIDTEHKGRNLNLLSLFHGVGSLIAPIVITIMVVSGFGWQSAYQGIIVLLIIQSIMLIRLRLQGVEPEKKASSGSFKNIIRCLRSKKVLLMSLVLTFYVAAETGFLTWQAEYLTQIKGVSASAAASYASIFFFCIMVGRFVSSFIVDKVGYRKMLLIASGITLVLVMALMILPGEFAFIAGLLGLSFATMFPTAIALLTSGEEERQNEVIGLSFAVSGLGGVIGSYSIGVLSELYGLKYGFMIIGVFWVIIPVCLIGLAERKGVEICYE